MKTIASLAFAALAILACQREVEVPVDSTVPTYTVTITAGITGTRTAYDEAGKFSWVAGDKINVLVSKGEAKRQVVFTTADGGEEVQFTGEVPEGFELSGVAAYALEFNADKGVWVLPDTVTPAADPLSGTPLFGF